MIFSDKAENGFHFPESVLRRCSVKKTFLKILQNSLENTCARVSFLIKLTACNLIKKETLAHVFSCELCEISNKIFFYRTPLVAASDVLVISIFSLEKIGDRFCSEYLFNCSEFKVYCS